MPYTPSQIRKFGMIASGELKPEPGLSREKAKALLAENRGKDGKQKVKKTSSGKVMSF